MNANTWELMYEASQTLYFSQLEDCNYFGILPYSVLYNKFHVSNKKNSGLTTLVEAVALDNIGVYIVEHELLIGALVLRHYGTSTQYT